MAQENVDLANPIGKVDVFNRMEGGVEVLTQAVALVNPTTGAVIAVATEATQAQILAALAALNVTVTGTVALDAGTLAALESITVNNPGLTDAQLRATALPVSISGDVTYAEIIDDYSSALYTYECRAAVGSLETQAVWQISRLTLATGKVEWATGDAAYTHRADQRTTLAYS